MPRTTYLWLAILLLTFLVPKVVEYSSAVGSKPSASKRATSDGELNTQSFSKYVAAETNTRQAFGEIVSGSKANPTLAAQAKRDLADAVKDYRTLADSTHAPNMSRRTLLLTDEMGKPFASRDLDTLAADLKRAKKPTPEVKAEILLWTQMLADKRVAPGDVSAAETRIRAMKLRFLEDLALADLYRAAGDNKSEKATRTRLRETASQSLRGQASLIFTFLIGGLIGLVLFTLFLIAAFGKYWSLIRRVPTAPLHLGWGDLLDAFLFYLAAFKGIGLLLSLPLERWGGGLTIRGRLGIVLLMEVGVGLGAAWYVARAARRRAATLTDLGLTTRGDLLGNVAYGVAGYMAGMPLMLLMGWISQKVFHDSTTTTPNPVIPLMVGERDPLGRFFIFVLASICAPIFEEFFFRGVLFTGLRTRFRWVPAALISAVCFAVMHPIQDWLPIVTLGFTLATLREMRQSLVPGMVAHFLQNTLTFLMLSSLFQS